MRLWLHISQLWVLVKTSTEPGQILPSWTEYDWVRWWSQPVLENDAFSDEIRSLPCWIRMIISSVSVASCVPLCSAAFYGGFQKFLIQQIHVMLLSMSEFIRSYLRAPKLFHLLWHSLHVLDKQKAGTVKEIISVWEQDVNTLQVQVSQHSQPAFEPFAVVVAARQAANFRSLLNASYFWWKVSTLLECDSVVYLPSWFQRQYYPISS